MERKKLPKDFALRSCGNGEVTVFATIKTQHELNAVLWALKTANSHLPSRRAAVAADFGLPEKHPKSYQEQLIDAGIMQ